MDAPTPLTAFVGQARLFHMITPSELGAELRVDAKAIRRLMRMSVISELEAAFLANRGLVERIEANRRDPGRLVRRRRD